MQMVVGKELTADRLATLRAAFPEVTFAYFLDAPESMQDADAFIGRIPPDAYALAGERLRWVHSPGTGIDKILAVPGIVESEIVVTNTRGAQAPFVAEHAFALMLTIYRAMPDFARDQQNRVFRQFAREVPMNSLYGKRLLIIGMGNIGTAIARRALAFEMTVVGLDPHVTGHLGEDFSILPMEHLDNELEAADILVVAAPYTAETDNLIDARRLGLLRFGAIVIGISRGGIIDERALAERLREETLAGAGLDVYVEEPLPPDHFLWDTPRLVMTPHAAPNSPITKDLEMEITMENIRRFIEDEPLLNVCDKVAGF
jgi:phosphoglycerate dehydrogenase-like enzyme